MMTDVKISAFGRIRGQKINLYTLFNKNGHTVSITNYGATITNWHVPDRYGKWSSIVVGFDNIKDYLNCTFYPGAIIGRYSNFIANAEFLLDGQKYSLSKNYENHHLHGGNCGFDKKIWQLQLLDRSRASITLYHISLDGDEGYPGNVKVWVTYSLGDDNSLSIKYRAQTDKPTVLSLTNHTYFNLVANKDAMLEHSLTVLANTYTPTDRKIPTGELSDVHNTPYDFREHRPIKAPIDKVEVYNVNYVIQKNLSEKLALAATLSHHSSGRTLKVYTTMPGLQLYVNNGGICLETQHFPNAPNHTCFPSPILLPGQEYQHITRYVVS
ncbi:galactose mutarotase [Sphingobacterium phlebotomi]|uniref:Aldose 1-epimerase n=1 Tax=Sphingobacterium phlebotomi TaxID=2605433 RepID=A0A5D4H555_9SPHI|nr:aldose epimerase family protein [Sphingobacterium phlebotomi]TYR35798.1 galactose mutarotase [Sphingobacterium phlebotomi]